VRLHGTLRLPSGSALSGHEVARVRLLDVSRADASSVTVAETSVPLMGGAESVVVDFELDAPALDLTASYTLAAHVDMSGSGDLTQGDLLTTRHIDVSPEETDQRYDVPLERVT
jgi:putative lipoprotein